MPSGSEDTTPLQRPRRLSHRRGEETRGYVNAQQDREKGQSALQRQSSGRSTTSALKSSEDTLHAKRGESSSNRAIRQGGEETRGRARNLPLPSGVEVSGGSSFATSLAPSDRGRKSEIDTEQGEEEYLPRSTTPSSSSDALWQEREPLRTASASASARHDSSAGTLIDPGIASSRRSASGPTLIERVTRTRGEPSSASSSNTTVSDNPKAFPPARARPPRRGNHRQRLGGRKEVSTGKEEHTLQGRAVSSPGQRENRGGSEEHKHDSALTSSASGKRRKSNTEEISSPLDTLHTFSTTGASATKNPLAAETSPDSSPEPEATIAGSQEEALPMSTERRYQLRIVQQPTLGCAFGTNILSRLAIAPPLIVRLHVVDRQGQDVTGSTNVPSLICHASLTTESGQSADMLSPVSSPQARSRGPSSSPATSPTSPGSRRMLYGTLVASPLTLSAPEPYGRNGIFFFFPEISVRATGRFCLRITLMALPSGPSSTSHSQPLASISTAPFNIVTTASYVAPPITDITRHFAAHGVGLLLPPGHSAD